MIEIANYQGSVGAARLINLQLRARSRAACRVLRYTRADNAKRDADTTIKRHLLVWLARADGQATVEDVGRHCGVTHGAVVRILAKLRPFPGVVSVAGKDSDTEMLMRWVSATARGTLQTGDLSKRYRVPLRGGKFKDEPSHLERVYAELRTDGWPWRRAGVEGNRGNRSARPKKGVQS